MRRRSIFPRTIFLAPVFAGLLGLTSCHAFRRPPLETPAQQQEAERLKDQKAHADLAEQVTAAAQTQDKKQESIKGLQAQIDALDQQISDARSKGQDCQRLEKAEEDLEAQKFELQRQ